MSGEYLFLTEDDSSRLGVTERLFQDLADAITLQAVTNVSILESALDTAAFYPGLRYGKQEFINLMQETIADTDNAELIDSCQKNIEWAASLCPTTFVEMEFDKEKGTSLPSETTVYPAEKFWRH